MLISLCVPCMNRSYDLKKSLPSMLEAAGNSPPVEIAIVDYNSTDDLAQYIQSVFRMPIPTGVQLLYRKYTARDFFQMAHARNLSVLLSTGDVICIMSADVLPAPDYVAEVRRAFSNGTIWAHGDFPALLSIRRGEFIDAGGFDERFEFYGPEDRDFSARLLRRGLRPTILPRGLLSINRTPNMEKVKNYRLPLSKREMGDQMWAVYLENCKLGVLRANPDGWGAWE